MLRIIRTNLAYFILAETNTPQYASANNVVGVADHTTIHLIFDLHHFRFTPLLSLKPLHNAVGDRPGEALLLIGVNNPLKFGGVDHKAQF